MKDHRINCLRRVGIIFLFFLLSSQLESLAQSAVFFEGPSKEVKKMSTTSVKDVQVGGEIGRRIDLILQNNIEQLDIDKHLLNHFKNKNKDGGYVGLGKLIDAFVYYSLYTKDKPIEDKKDLLIKTVINYQEEDGYIGMINKEKRMFQGAAWDIHEMSYIIYALSQDYRYFNNNASLLSAEKAANYIMTHWCDKPQEWQELLNVAETVALTGLEEAMVNLYDLTDNKKYLDFLLNERDFENWDLDIIIGRRPLIQGHIYSFLSRVLAQVKLNVLYPSPKLLGQAEKAFDFLVNKDGMVITGGAGQMEIWDNSQDGRSALAESCATAYFLRVCSQLLQLTGDSYFGDLMERSLYNSLFGALSPNCEHTRYYTPFEGDRVYSHYPSYCCSNNLRRILPALPEMIYLTGSNSLAVNLYTDSETKVLINNKYINIKQETDYPSSGHIKIELIPDSDIAFNLMLRIPAWSKKTVVVVNSEKIDATPSGGQFFIINRKWSKGDQVEIRFDMQPRLISGVNKQLGRVAVMRGPLVYCLNPENTQKFSKLDGASLGHITLYPKTLELIADESVRPYGTAFKVQVWPPNDYQTLPINLHEIKLTEFSDPNGKAVYFKLQDPDKSEPDELFKQTGIVLTGLN